MPLPDVESAAAALEALRSRRPLVQSLTNVVSATFLPNVLLAAGASTAVIDNPHEADGFARVADAVLVNLGTPDDAQAEAFTLAAQAARDVGTPWVLDPVGVGGLPWRTELAGGLLEHRPTTIRGNASEVLALVGLGGGGRGVDSGADAADAAGAAVDLLGTSEVVAASGPVDHLVGTADGEVARVQVSGGSAFLPQVTATGCALGGLVAAYLAVAADPLTGAVAAHVHVAVAAEAAEEVAHGPGSFVPAFLDALAATGPDDIRARGRVATSS
jgi:hydroxyethylthiazole kinase